MAVVTKKRQPKNTKVDFINDSRMKKWRNDAYVNSLIKKVRAKGEDAAEAEEELAEILITACRSYAGKEKLNVEHYAHAGNEVDDIAQEMFAEMWGAIKNDRIGDMENFKSYIVRCGMNGKTNFVNKESTTLSVFHKANSENKALLKKVLKGETVKTDKLVRDYALNVVAAQSDGFLSMDDTCRTAAPGVDHDVTIGERIVDNSSMDQYDLVDMMEALDSAIREMPDPVMRLVMSSVMMGGPDRSGYNEKIRVTAAKKRCEEEFGIDNDLFDEVYRRGTKVWKFFQDREKATA